jgi:hypothetical protein
MGWRMKVMATKPVPYRSAHLRRNQEVDYCGGLTTSASLMSCAELVPGGIERGERLAHG